VAFVVEYRLHMGPFSVLQLRPRLTWRDRHLIKHAIWSIAEKLGSGRLGTFKGYSGIDLHTCREGLIVEVSGAWSRIVEAARLKRLTHRFIRYHVAPATTA